MNSIHSRNSILTIQVYTLNVINTDYVDKEQIPGTHSKKIHCFTKQLAHRIRICCISQDKGFVTQ